MSDRDGGRISGMPKELPDDEGLVRILVQAAADYGEAAWKAEFGKAPPANAERCKRASQALMDRLLALRQESVVAAAERLVDERRLTAQFKLLREALLHCRDHLAWLDGLPVGALRDRAQLRQEADAVLAVTSPAVIGASQRREDTT